MTPTTEIGIIIGLILNIFLQIGQMYFDFRKEDQTREITDLKEDYRRAIDKIDEQGKQIQTLQGEVFQLKKSEAYYIGRLEALESLEKQQEKKMVAVQAYVDSKSNA